VEIGVAIFRVDVKSSLFMLVIEVVLLVVSHCNHGHLSHPSKLEEIIYAAVDY
jgi:hypothetical protein